MNYSLKSLKEDVEAIFDHEHPEQYLQITTDTPGAFQFRLHTQNNVYQIGAREGYLSCIVQSRRDLNTEDHYRSARLVDGKLDRETWDHIKNRIIGYELLRVSYQTYKPLQPIMKAATLLDV